MRAPDDSARRVRLTAIVCLICGVAASSGCGGTTLRSRQREGAIVIDGRSDEWRDSMITLEQRGIAVGLANDDEFLYVCLASSDPDLNQRFLSQGLILWLDGSGGKQKRFGLEYPLAQYLAPRNAGPAAEGTNPAGSRKPVDGPKPADGPNPAGSGAPADGPTPAGGPETGFERLAIRGPGPDDRQTMRVADAPGMEAAIASASGTLVYELKVPLAPNNRHPYAIEAAPGRPIGAMLEIPQIPLLKEAPKEGGGPRAGRAGGGAGGGMGGGGMGGGMHGGGGGGRRRGGMGGGARGGETSRDAPTTEQSKPPAPVKIRFTIRLAEPR